MTGVFSAGHQRTIDEINSDGWHYLARRANEIATAFAGKNAAIGDTLYFQVNDVEVAVRQGDPLLEWWFPHQPNRVFTRGFCLSVKSSPESTPKKAVSKPIDWYMLCIFLQIGLNMASLGLAAPRDN